MWTSEWITEENVGSQENREYSHEKSDDDLKNDIIKKTMMTYIRLLLRVLLIRRREVSHLKK